MSDDAYGFRMIRLMEQDATKWHRLAITAKEAEDDHAETHRKLAALGLAPKHKPPTWAGTLPYIYMSIKA
eukprot:7932083-Alexandrium_andersonii.AAC.1